MREDRLTKKKKGNYKPLFILLGFLLLFCLVICLLTCERPIDKAIQKINISSSPEEVRKIYESCKVDFLESDEYGNTIVSVEFQDAVRNKLNKFSPDQEQVEEWLTWIPPASTNINVIIVPDLSRRIIDEVNNPNQITNDFLVLNTIWKAFVESNKLKRDSKDKLIVDVTDIDQARGQFSKVANQLQFDLSSHKGKSNRLYFTPEKDKQFQEAVTGMYESARQNPLGANYRSYLQRYLANRLKSSTLNDVYENKVIIITDGYLEAENATPDTKIAGYQSILYPSVEGNCTLHSIRSNHLSIPKVNIDLSNTEFLICEVNERKAGKDHDFEILKTYWYDWLQKMGVKKMNFIQREQASTVTKKSVDDFIKGSYKPIKIDDAACESFPKPKPPIILSTPADVRKPEVKKKIPPLSANEQFKEGVYFYRAGQYNNAFTCFQIAAAKGHSQSSFYLGEMYEKGRGVNVSASKAVEWYSKSAKQGNKDAQSRIDKILSI